MERGGLFEEIGYISITDAPTMRHLRLSYDRSPRESRTSLLLHIPLSKAPSSWWRVEPNPAAPVHANNLARPSRAIKMYSLFPIANIGSNPTSASKYHAGPISHVIYPKSATASSRASPSWVSFHRHRGPHFCYLLLPDVRSNPRQKVLWSSS